MSDDLVRMADILQPLPPTDKGAATAWLVIAALSGVLLAIWWLRRRRHPLRRLACALEAGRLSPREAAHQLAPWVSGDGSMRGELDRLRFSRQPPQAASVAGLIRRMRHGC